MPTRRTFLQQLTWSPARPPASACPWASARAAEAGRWFMPDEGEKQQRAFIAFGAQDAIWEDFTEDVQAALGRIARPSPRISR
jgi:agmatine deiminase